jgi:menaquinone-dependent protoporphyrinogen oxidase
MKCLILYGTVEGHTLKIAKFISQRVQITGHEVCLHDASGRDPDLDLSDLDAFLAAAPVHQQRHPDAVIDWLKAHAESLNALPSALVSVSLSAAFENGIEEAQMYVDRLLERTAWRPTTVHLAAGALRYKKYDYFQEQIIRHIVLKDRAPEQIEGEHEFTNWEALAAFIDDHVSASSKVKTLSEPNNICS